MRLVSYFMKVILIVAGVLLLMVINDLIHPHREEIKVTLDPAFYVYPDDVDDQWNREARVEAAWNLDTDADSVTQDQFNDRYLTP